MRYSGKLGLVEQQEVRPGIWEEIVTEVSALGTTEQTTTNLSSADDIIPRLSTTTSFTIPARGVGPQDNSNIRYLTYKGARWEVRSIVDEPPMLVIYIGEKYNGPTPQ